jgi:hypothetical protein
MKIRLIISLFIACGVLTCATKPIHSVTIFAIEGRVLDKESNFPLDNVNVYFIDTGFDETLSKEAVPLEIGHSDAKGKINLRFNYLWQRKESAFYDAARKTFEILLSRDSYKTQRFHFKESDLPTDGITYLVNLEDVLLVRESK